jgi:hypothetical protein
MLAPFVTTLNAESPPAIAHVTTAATSLDQQLAGKTIRTISITLLPVFEETGDNIFYSGANKLKMTTQEDVIRRELLFKVGEQTNEFTLRESERVLRNLGYLRRIYMVPTFDGEFVDIEVRVQDTWTLIPQVGVSSGSGNSRQSIGLSESNIAGLGKRIELLYEEEENRETIEAVWDDNRVLGSDQSFLAAYFTRSDGDRLVFAVARPLRSLLDRQSWRIASDYGDTIGRLFEAGEERYIFRQRNQRISSSYTTMRGDPSISARRFSLGYEYAEDEFLQANAQDYQDLDLDPTEVSNDKALLPGDRRFTGPLFAYEQIEPDFIAMNYIDRFERIEDYNLGEEYSFRMTLAPTLLGSARDALLFSATRSGGMHTSSQGFLRGELGLGSRIEPDGFTDTLARVELKYYHVFGIQQLGRLYLGRHTFASSFFLDFGDDLDRDREFTLGADNALRGYEARTFVGDKRFAINIEDRVHLADDVFRLVSVGAAVFVDGGAASREPLGTMLQDEFYSDVGVGLRFAFPRSTGGRVLRVDLAYPLREGDDGSQRFELRILFSGGQLFNSQLRSESLGRDSANVAVGFDR